MTDKKKLLIALDIDGVIFDFMEQFLRVYNLRRGTRVTVQDITSFMPHESLEAMISEEQWNEAFEYFENSGGYATLNAYEGVRTAIDNILAAGHEIVYVTSRHSNFKGQTDLCFILNKIPAKKIYYAPRGKRAILKKLNPDIFVDDAIKNCKDAEKAGLKNIYIMDAAYNRNDEGNKFKRISNLIQLEREVVPAPEEKKE